MTTTQFNYLEQVSISDQRTILELQECVRMQHQTIVSLNEDIQKLHRALEKENLEKNTLLAQQALMTRYRQFPVRRLPPIAELFNSAAP